MTMLRTQLADLLGISLPIVQAPIGSASCPQLAAAVSNAGGLGMLALSWHGLEAARHSIRKTRTLTDRPFGVNLVLQWDQAERLEACLEERVLVVSFSWGDPKPYLTRTSSANVKVMHTVASAAEAQRVADLGVDVIVAQGWEAGGHLQGQVATMALVPRVVDAVAPIPVVAAGGIADGRGLAAALALGAQGAWIGTRFLASEEARSHSEYRRLILQAQETDTVYTGLFDGGWSNAPHRVIENSTVANWKSAGSPPVGKRPSEGAVVARTKSGDLIHLYDDAIPLASMTGDVERLALYAGQSVGLVHDIKNASAIVHEIAEEARSVLLNLIDRAEPHANR
jgi:NAD(P)H-dependent flavin oxidoreductase YrpB (nitropropane dioxygenase family)